jgi:hypothetical protein
MATTSSGARLASAGLTWRELLILVLLATAGAAALLAALPANSLPRLSHRTLHLPGPGSGVAVIGPLLALVALLARAFVRKPGAMLVCCAVLGALHSMFAEELFPHARTVGTVGPLPLRILAVLVLGAALEIVAALCVRRSRWLRYPAAAAAACLAFLTFYWTALYPLVSKRSPALRTCLILGVLTVAAGAVVAGALAPLLDKSRSDRMRPGQSGAV